MVVGQEFGGGWTEEKLEFAVHYLKMYSVALKNRFNTYFVDGFAGSGKFKVNHEVVDTQKDFWVSPTNEEEHLGSALRVLDAGLPFRHHYFVEKKAANVELLRKALERHPNATVLEGDANIKVAELTDKLKGKKNRVAVFLDPFGMQVKWNLLTRLAEAKNTDVILLFPISAVTRTLARKFESIDQTWWPTLDGFFGCSDWRSLYREKKLPLMPAVESGMVRGEAKDIADYFRSRLKEIFCFVSDPFALKNANGTILFELFILNNNPSARAQGLVSSFADETIKSLSVRSVKGAGNV